MTNQDKVGLIKFCEEGKEKAATDAANKTNFPLATGAHYAGMAEAFSLLLEKLQSIKTEDKHSSG